MPRRHTHICPQREAVEALSVRALPESQRLEVQQHLEDCESCLAAFRKETADNFPRIRQYTVIERIDEGGFGIVYKAIHHQKQRSEALKMLYGRTDSRAAYFENEVHLIGKLRHPNIATLYDAHLSSPPLYYCMEFVEGRRLDRALMDGEGTLADRIQVVKIVAGAIDYAHKQGVVHRDIKPQNIIIDAEGQPHIVDFGIAKKLGLTERTDGNAEASPDSPEGVVGTLGYMAPEQAHGERVDARGDIYSLGALLYHCVTGRPPRKLTRIDGLEETLRNMRIARSQDLSAIIRQCLALDPKARYGSAAELASDLDNYLVGRPTRAATRNSAVYRARRISAYVIRNRPTAVAVALVAFAITLLTLTLWSIGAGALVGPPPTGNEVALIGFLDSTYDALRNGEIGRDLPGLDFTNRKSWRLLHGRLMSRLAHAEPRVVVWDYFLPDRQPDFDPAFVEGVRRVKAPVIVGVESYDVNAQPRLSAEIREAVHAYGALHSDNPAAFRDEVDITIAIRRGFEPAVPSLCVAAFGAFRFPDCDVLPVPVPGEARLQLRYRKRSPTSTEVHWRDETDSIPISRTSISEGDRLTRRGDRISHARWRLPASGTGRQRVIPYEKVLSADDEQLRAWFAGRAVVIGHMFGGTDRHRLSDDEWIYGCEIQSHVLQAMIAGTRHTPYTRSQIAQRTTGWCLLAALLVMLTRLGHSGPSLRTTVVVTVVVCAGALLLAAYTAVRIRFWLWVEIGIAVSALLMTGSLLFLAATARQRQLRLAPDLAAPSKVTGDSTTVAASPQCSR